MEKQKLEETISFPEGCQLSQERRKITIKGPKGEISRLLPDLEIKVNAANGELKISYEKASKSEKTKLFTTKSHLKNMIKGVTEGYTYKLKICTGHFPMNVSMKDNALEIKNFIGEKVPRVLKIMDGASVKITGDIIEVQATDKEVAGQTAGSIEKLTKRPNFDKRIFQDGIYIIEKDGKKVA